MKGMDPVAKKRSWAVIAAAWLALAGLLGSSLMTVQAQPAPAYKPTMVAEVRVQGNRSVSTQHILNLINTRTNKEYNPSIAQDDVRALLKRGSFKDVKVDAYPAPQNGQDGRDWVVVYFTVSEYPNLVSEVVVRNARHVKLDDVDSLKQIRKGSPLNPTLNQRAKNEIEDEYRKSGYFFAAVHLEEGSQHTDKRVVLNVSEGPLVRVRAIRFEGNETLASAARLKTQIMSKKVFIHYLRAGGVFSPEMVDFDVSKLQEYYRNNGYLDVQVSRELIFSDDRQWVDVIFHLHEGVRFHVKDVTVDGIKNVSQAKAESIIQLKPGQVYKGHTSERDQQNLIDLVGWQGYKINVREELYFPEPGQVDVRYQVLDEVRPPTRAGEIHIIGNTVTRDNVIRRLLGFRPGQILPWPEIRYSEENLVRSQLFEVNPQMGIRPTITVYDDPNNPDSEFKDVVVQVNETYTGSFMLGVGVNSDMGLVGNIVLNERNFDLFNPPRSLADIFEGRAWRGGGQEFRIEAAPGTHLQRYTIQFREPFLFDTPNSLAVAGYYYDRIFNEYTERRVGGRFSLGRQLDRFWNITGSLRLEGINVDDVPFFAPPDYLDVAGQNFLIAPRIAVARDSRNSYLRPTEGSRVEASYEHVFGDFTFPVLNLEASKYFTLTERRDGSGKQVLAARSQVSWAGDDVPVFERFFAGGYRSLRGFEFRGVGPRDNGFNVGGNFMMLASLEYQVPVLANDSVYLVAFLDSGTVERNVAINDYRVSAGIGARIVVPMMGPVPIALDFGFPIVRGPGDREQVFSFYVGVFR